jgi:hypothetical protein
MYGIRIARIVLLRRDSNTEVQEHKGSAPVTKKDLRPNCDVANTLVSTHYE